MYCRCAFRRTVQSGLHRVEFWQDYSELNKNLSFDSSQNVVFFIAFKIKIYSGIG